MNDKKIDVLAAMDRAAEAIEAQWAIYEGSADLLKARAAVAELIGAARRASATLCHAYHTTLTGRLADYAHEDYQRLDAALARVVGGDK